MKETFRPSKTSIDETQPQLYPPKSKMTLQQHLSYLTACPIGVNARTPTSLLLH
jgi:hypothetical protein